MEPYMPAKAPAVPIKNNMNSAPSSAIAEIHFEQGWNLTPAGTANPLRYWSHVHFEGDPK
jgi:hypothetical protein